MNSSTSSNEPTREALLALSAGLFLMALFTGIWTILATLIGTDVFGWGPPLVLALVTVTLLLGGQRTRTRGQSLPTSSTDSDITGNRELGRAFGRTFGTEFGLIAAISLILGIVNQAAYMLPARAIIIGVHYLRCRGCTG